MKKSFFRCIDDEATYPSRATKHSAGYDLTAISYEIDRDNQVVIYDTGIGVGHGWTKSMFGDVRARSGVFKRNGWMLVNGAGVVDADYPGTIKLVFIRGLSEVLLDEIPYAVGERIGQVIVTEFKTEDDKPKAQRAGGYGSTGK